MYIIEDLNSKGQQTHA